MNPPAAAAVFCLDEKTQVQALDRTQPSLPMVLSRKALTNTSFTSVAELETRIDCWVSHWNDNPEPFVWTKPADEILDKVARGPPRCFATASIASATYEILHLECGISYLARRATAPGH